MIGQSCYQISDQMQAELHSLKVENWMCVRPLFVNSVTIMYYNAVTDLIVPLLYSH